jgi:hypothetical protein
MESNVRFVQTDPGLREGACELVTRAVATAHGLLTVADQAKHIVRGGRKASGAE